MFQESILEGGRYDAVKRILASVVVFLFFDYWF